MKVLTGINHRDTETLRKNNIKWFSLCLCVSVVILLSACTAPATVAPTNAPTGMALAPTASDTVAPTATGTLTPAPSETTSPSPVPPTVTLTPDTRLPPEDWREWPVIPAVSARARQVYQQGVAEGNDPHRFSKVGDCQNIPSHFLANFDHPDQYVLGDKYQSLQAVISNFAGSWGRDSQAVRGGYNVAAVVTPYQADPKACGASETPLACELRLYQPSIALVSMETWWAGKKSADYEKYLRQIVDYALSKGVLPVLATKADNLEGDYSINLAIARVAYDYDLPLWNFWRAVQPLPSHGLQSDGFHLTHDPTRPEDPLLYRRLSDPQAELFAWPVRNITALQALNAVWQGVQ